MSKIRRLIYAGKDIRDVISDIEQLDSSESDLPKEILNKIQHHCLKQIERLNNASESSNPSESLQLIMNETDTFYRGTIEYLYKRISDGANSDVPVSSITNTLKKSTSAIDDLAKSLMN